MLADGTDADVVAVAEDELEAAVQVFHVRGGRVRGQRGWVVDKVEDVTTGEPGRAVPPAGVRRGAAQRSTPWSRGEVLVPALPADDVPRRDRAAPVAQPGCARGSNVSLQVPQRGDKRALLETVQRNAQQALALHKTKRASDLTTRSQALDEIQEALDLQEAPLRIECFDVSPRAGHERGGLHGRLRGRAAAQERVPPVRRPRGRGPGRRPLHARGRPPPLRPLPRGARPRRPARRDRPPRARRPRPGDRAAARFAYPPQLVVVDGGAAGRRRPGPRRAGHRRRRARAAWPSGWRRSGCPAGRPGDPAAHQRGASTCCSGSATRRTGSPSPTTGRSGRRP